MDEIRVPAGESWVTAAVFGTGATLVVLGHGAGGSRRAPFLVRTAQAIADSGRRALLYNFPYADRRGRVPDPPEALEATVRAAGEHARSALGAARIVHGGKSMGGRIASQAVAKGAPADALVFLGYPLHPPGRPERLRDRHLPQIRVPMLFLQGTRDAFARWELIEALVGRLGGTATLVRFDEADHSFVVPKRTGRTTAEVEASLRRALVGWLDARGL